WRGYKHLLLLATNNTLKSVDLGLVHSSAADSPISNILNRLSTDGDVETKGVSPNFLVRNWPPAFKEWATKSVRDAFYSSPTYPRVPNAEFIKGTIARGVESGMLAYVGKTAAGKYLPFAFNKSINPYDIEFSDDMFVITAETAMAYRDPEARGAGAASTGEGSSGAGSATPSATPGVADEQQPAPTPAPTKIAGIRWSGDVPPQKWMNFYTKVLSRFAGTSGLKITIQIDVNPPDGLSKQTLDETRGALRELGLKDELDE
ncbi:MAG: hypothetical protein Q8O34_04910, partial [Rhodocyclaceae bacterium]|nr:hypothetical protein [Rhodocyclaceae bacterium]